LISRCLEHNIPPWAPWDLKHDKVEISEDEAKILEVLMS